MYISSTYEIIDSAFRYGSSLLKINVYFIPDSSITYLNFNYVIENPFGKVTLKSLFLHSKRPIGATKLIYKLIKFIAN